MGKRLSLTSSAATLCLAAFVLMVFDTLCSCFFVDVIAIVAPGDPVAACQCQAYRTTVET
jgi:hypothetical protein